MIEIFDWPPFYKIHINKETGETKIFSHSNYMRGKQLKFTNKYGYLRVSLNGKKHLIHRLVAKFCIGECPRGLCVNHKDGNKLNNRPDNLEYITLGENIKHACKIGLHISCRPEDNPRFIDGRSRNKKQYEHELYLKNREKYLERSRRQYAAKKALITK